MAIVKRLAEEYGFSVEDAMEVLDGKKGASVMIPFIRPVKGWCDGLKLNGRLFTQCSNKPMAGGELCRVCQKQADASGKPTCGLASERAAEGDAWRDPKGRKPAVFAKVMAKKGVERSAVESELKRLFGAEETFDNVFEMTKTSRGRPKKEETEKKQRGRPKKSKEVVAGDEGEDLILALIAQAKEAEETKEEVVETKPVEDVKPVEEKKKAKGRKTEEEKAAAKAAKEAEKEAEKEAKKEAKKAEKEAKKAKAAAKKEVKKTAVKEEAGEDDETEELMAESPVVEVNVVVKELNGVEYLVSGENEVYDVETQERVGVWNKMTGEIEMDEEEMDE